MYIVLFITFISALIICFFMIMDRSFYRKFTNKAAQVSLEAGKHVNKVITEDDLLGLPEPVAHYIRFSGLIGKSRISSMHIFHSGTFRPGADKKFMPVKGEYYLTAKKPSFCWYGKISMIPGLTVSAFDSYFNGKGRMFIKAMSAIRIADAQSDVVNFSAFGRCVAEMTLVPSFFLDKQSIKWTSTGANKAACTLTDAGLSTNAMLYFKDDGSLDKIEVDRYYDRGKTPATVEKFTGKCQGIKDFNGLKLASFIDGYWNLKEGDLHYVHFVLDRAEFE